MTPPTINLPRGMRYLSGMPRKVPKGRIVNEDAALDWIDSNQLGRRNLSADQRSIIRGRRYNRLKKQHGGDRRSADISSCQSDNLKTAEAISAKHGVSWRTVIRDGKRAEALAEALKPRAKENQKAGLESSPKRGGKVSSKLTEPIDARARVFNAFAGLTWQVRKCPCPIG